MRQKLAHQLLLLLLLVANAERSKHLCGHGYWIRYCFAPVTALVLQIRQVPSGTCRLIIQLPARSWLIYLGNDRLMRRQRGFTPIELILVIVMLGILSAFALPRFAKQGRDARIANVQTGSC